MSNITSTTSTLPKLRTCKCLDCGEPVQGIRALNSLSFESARSSAKGATKRREVCGLCLESALEREEVPVLGTSTDGFTYTMSVYVPGSPWHQNQNAHGELWLGGYRPTWGVGHRGVYWRAELQNLKRLGIFRTLQGMEFEGLIRADVRSCGCVERVELRLYQAEELAGALKLAKANILAKLAW